MNNQSYQSLNFCYNYGYNATTHQLCRAYLTIIKMFGKVGFDAMMQGSNDRFDEDMKQFKGVKL